MTCFKLISEFEPKGDQPEAIKALTKDVLAGEKYQVLLGVTGSGKTFTMANVIANVCKPTLIVAPNKTLAAQLYNEFKAFFPENAVEYFVSYYDYYQPEAYIPSTDTYIQKDSAINEIIDKLRHSATRSVVGRRDVIVVSSVSCIYGLGAPDDYLEMRIDIDIDMEFPRDKLLLNLVNVQYTRNDVDFHRGVFRVRGDRVEIFPAYEEDKAVRIDFFGDIVDSIAEIDPLRGSIIKKLNHITIYPATHYVTKAITRNKIIEAVAIERNERVNFFRDQNKLIEAQRIEERTNFDLEMLMEIGYCNGIENYSRHLTGRNPGEPPPTLLDYFPKDFLLFIDESHITVPQISAMYKGDKSRKETLIEYGFRLPSAIDNRPLRFDEFWERSAQTIFVSATPADYEKEKAGNFIVEQIVRPTGLLDPPIEIRDAKNQVDDLLEEIRIRIERNERVLITTLTKRMAEDLSEYYSDIELKVKYLHSDIKTIERMEIITDLRKGVFDVLIGINLLREGLDIPEVSLVAILDADKEGFLRSERSLVQTCGRAARNVKGIVIMYAEKITAAMQKAIGETQRRREIQESYNKKFNINPQTIVKSITFNLFDTEKTELNESVATFVKKAIDTENIEELLTSLEKEMLEAAKELAFEKAAMIRDRIKELKKIMLNSEF
ncbi:MAG: excinuclease ABC subunit UvrB [Desulfobacterales bacterium]|nr:excinuclease ABC subunit UvrB [Desulfobacterales bacterium]